MDVHSWLKMLGVDTSNIPDGAHVEMLWTNLPSSWGWFVLFGIVVVGAYLVFWLYRREIDTCPMWAKVVLGCLRVSVLLVLVLIILGPALVYTKTTTLKPFVVVLRDASQSMKTPDPYLDDQVAARVANVLGTSAEEVRSQRPDRVALLEKALNAKDHALIRELEYRGKLKIVDFTNRIEKSNIRQPRSREADEEAAAGENSSGQVKPPQVEPLPQYVANGQGTDIYKALEEGLSERHTAAIILLTDGQHTAKEMDRDDLLELARQEDRPEDERVPLLIVGAGDPHKPRNLSVADVYANPRVFPGDPFEVRVVVRGQGVEDEPIRVDLIEQRLNDDGTPAGEPKVVESRSNERIPESGKLDLPAFEVKAGEAGVYGYTVRVNRIENESNDDDNESATPTIVKVLDQKARVLLVAGAPTWEYRMVQRLLTREKWIDLSCWLQTLDVDRAQEGNTVITQMPIEKKNLFQYDVIMMFDPDPTEFDEAWITLLKEFVSDHAGGMLYMAGPKFSGRFLGASRTRTMRDVLPVRLGDVGAMEVQSLLATNTRAWPLSIVESNVDEPIMKFGGDTDDSLSRWRNMPGIFWSFPSEEPKPAARVLIEHSDPTLRRLTGSRPLLVTGQYGSGRTIYMGFNGTWRWRKIGHNAEYFKQFWNQATQYLIKGRSLEGQRRGYVEAEKARYQLGDQVKLEVRDLKDENFTYYDLPQIQAQIQTDGEQPQTVTLQKVPDQDGVFQTTYTPRTTGRYAVKVAMPEATSANPPKIETSFHVTLPTVETNEVSLNKPLLVDLASASGGKYFEIDEMSQIPASVPQTTRETEHRSKPKPLWDTDRFLILLVLLLSMEWAVRKAYKLL